MHNTAAPLRSHLRLTTCFGTMFPFESVAKLLDFLTTERGITVFTSAERETQALFLWKQGTGRLLVIIAWVC